MAAYIGSKYAVGLSCGTAALHLATKLAGEKLYGQAKPNQGTLQGHRVFCSDMTFDASINPVAYEDGEAIFIDTERDTWNIDQGGCGESSRVTTHDDPVFIEEGVVHYCVGNMPGAVPRTSTIALTNATLKYGLEIANKGLEKACAKPAIAAGVKCYLGKLTNKNVADAHGYEFVELAGLF